MAKPITPEEMTAYIEATWNKCQEEAWQEQKPVAWHEPGSFGNVTTHKQWALENGWEPLYTAPPKKEWVGLSDDEIKEIIGHWGDTPVKGYTRKLFDQIESKLKDKNT